MFLYKKNAEISKTKDFLILKGMFSKTTYVLKHLCTKFQVSSIVLTSFRHVETTWYIAKVSSKGNFSSELILVVEVFVIIII